MDYETMNNLDTYIPPHMRDGFKLWIEHGISPGSFGRAVIDNDLLNVVAHADHINKSNIPTIVSWFYNYAPRNCWGSRNAASEWENGFREKQQA